MRRQETFVVTVNDRDWFIRLVAKALFSRKVLAVQEIRDGTRITTDERWIPKGAI